jgi:hypothetical protein
MELPLADCEIPQTDNSPVENADHLFTQPLSDGFTLAQP